MDTSENNLKITDPGEVAALVDTLREQGKRVILCHGIFDLVHIGHIRHLEAARAEGDCLIVTVIPDELVGRGPGRPVFTLDMRIEAVAALECVDYVTSAPGSHAGDSIRLVRPDVFAEGPGYKAVLEARSAQEDPEIQAAGEVGAQFVLTNDVSFSTSGVINHHFSVISEETRDYLQAFKTRHSTASVLEWIKKAAELRVLVVGDAIIDDYAYVEAIGKSSKEPVLATRHVMTERFAGGILAVANNVASFAGSVDLLTVVGERKTEVELIRSSLNRNIRATLIQWPDAPTIVKRRYIDGYSFNKLFEVYEMEDAPLPQEQVEEMLGFLHDKLPGYDLVLVVDFGHGAIGPEAVELLCSNSRYLSLNVQSNAGNLGYHTLGSYPRADFVSTAENEIRLETRNRRGDLRGMIKEVADQMSAPRVIVTRGKYGCLCYGLGEDTIEIPSLANEVVDRVGAGDAFLSVGALISAAGAPIELVGFIGNAASAQAVATIGHQRSVSREALIEHVEALLK